VTSNRRFADGTVIVLTFFCVGLRLSELCGLNLQDTDLARGNTWIKGKGRRERELVPLPVLDAIRRYLRHRAARSPGRCVRDGASATRTGRRISTCQSKKGNVGTVEWDKGFAQLDRLRRSGLPIRPFDTTARRRAVLLLTGRLSRAAAITAQGYCQDLESRHEVPLVRDRQKIARRRTGRVGPQERLASC
jgi:hypothetical protein